MFFISTITVFIILVMQIQVLVILIQVRMAENGVAYQNAHIHHIYINFTQ